MLKPNFMITLLDSLNYKKLTWGAAIIFVIHNFEESIRMFRWMLHNLEYVPNSLVLLLPEDFGLYQMRNLIYISLVVASIIPIFITYFSIRKNNKGIAYIFLIITYLILFLNSVQHISSTLIALKYSPGTITASVLGLPFSIYFLRRSLLEGKISKRFFYKLIPISFVVYLLTLIIIWVISFYIERFLIAKHFL